MRFIITFAHEHPQGGGKEYALAPHPRGKSYIWGAFSPSGRGPFSPFFFLLGALFHLLGLFSLCGGGDAVSTYIEKFLGLFPLPKIGAHGLLE